MKDKDSAIKWKETQRADKPKGPSDPVEIKLSERLRELRTLRDWRQREVAGKVFVERTSYVNYETGKTMPEPDTLVRLARLYGVSVGYLLGEED